MSTRKSFSFLVNGPVATPVLVNAYEVGLNADVAYVRSDECQIDLRVVGLYRTPDGQAVVGEILSTLSADMSGADIMTTSKYLLVHIVNEQAQAEAYTATDQKDALRILAEVLDL